MLNITLNLKAFANLLIKFSNGQLSNLELLFYKEDGVEELHFSQCSNLNTEPLSCTQELIKLSQLDAAVANGAICRVCWQSFQFYNTDTLRDDPIEGRVLSRLVKVYQLQESFLEQPLSAYDLENGGRGPSLITTLFSIKNDISSLDLEPIFKSALEDAEASLSAILAQLRTKTDASEAFLRRQFAWDLVAFEESKITDIIFEALEEAQINISSDPEMSSFGDRILDKIALNNRAMLETLQDVRYATGFSLNDSQTELFMKAFTPKLENLLTEFVNTTGPNALVRIDARLGAPSYDHAMGALVTRYGFRSNQGNFFMVIPAFAHNWLSRYRQTGFQLSLLELGDTEDILDTTIRLNEGDPEGVYSSLAEAYKAAVNLV